MEELRSRTNEATEKFNTLSADIKEKEVRMAELLALKKHIFNYHDTREIYIQYRKSGYSKAFFEKHRESRLLCTKLQRTHLMKVVWRSCLQLRN